MEDKILSKFSFYDNIGYLLVGSISLLVLALDLFLLNLSKLIPSFDVQSIVLWLITAYFLGHIFQAIANIVIKENKTEFSDEDKELLDEAKTYFGLKKSSYGQIYNYCYMLASVKDITGQVQSFNAYYSLYRGWTIVFLLESIFLVILNLLKWRNDSWIILFLTSIIITILLFKRLKRFYIYSRVKTLQTFVILRKGVL